jgi:hypothetical protein
MRYSPYYPRLQRYGSLVGGGSPYRMLLARYRQSVAITSVSHGPSVKTASQAWLTERPLSSLRTRSAGLCVANFEARLDLVEQLA